jgi:hypothetical protein
VDRLRADCKSRADCALMPPIGTFRPSWTPLARRLLITIRRPTESKMRNVKAPEFTGYWFDDDATPQRSRSDEESTLAEQEALDDLAERVSAARSVI